MSLFALMQKVTKKIKAVEPTIAIGVKILAGPWAAALARNPKFAALKQWLVSPPMQQPTTLCSFGMGAKIFQCHGGSCGENWQLYGK